MLIDLYIKNFAIIEEVKLEFDSQLNVLTGETGAGKSIILGALSLILGARIDSALLLNKSEKCIVEARFDVRKNSDIQNLFKEIDLDYEEITIIRREINTQNKSRAFVNDTPVTLQVLKRISELLVDLHSQFDTSNLKNQQFIYEVVDALGHHEILLKEYQTAYKKQRKLLQEINELEENIHKNQQESDYFQFLYEELENANLIEKEEEALEEDIKKLENVEEILQRHSFTDSLLNEEEQGAIALLKKALAEIDKLQTLNKSYEEIYERFNSCFIELEDIAQELDRIANNSSDLDPSSLQSLEERRSVLFHLFKKHQVSSSEELLNIQKELHEKLQLEGNLEQRLEVLKKEWKSEIALANAKASELSKARIKTIKDFAPKINELIHLIGMPNAELQLAQKEIELHNLGKDHLQFLWDANKSGQFNSLDKVASGGELSRIMLCIKAFTAEALQLPTLIFDEVDTGISGEAARQVSLLLEELSKKHQVLCITHLSQVASKGKHHFYVYKMEIDGKVKTNIKVLSKEERIEHISEMISGGQVTEEIRSHIANQLNY